MSGVKYLRGDNNSDGDDEEEEEAEEDEDDDDNDGDGAVIVGVGNTDGSSDSDAHDPSTESSSAAIAIFFIPDNVRERVRPDSHKPRPIQTKHCENYKGKQRAIILCPSFCFVQGQSLHGCLRNSVARKARWQKKIKKKNSDTCTRHAITFDKAPPGALCQTT